MSTIIFDNFGGEVPRVSPRALPPNGAQLNQNLVPTSTEFRPAKGVKPVYTPPVDFKKDIKTLFRRESGPDGTLRTDETAGWFQTIGAMSTDYNACKSQVNSGVPDLYYFSINDGTVPMRLATEDNSPLLGVPPPDKPVITIPTKKYLNSTQATTWINDTFSKNVVEIIAAEMNRYYGVYPWKARYDGRLSKAGPTAIEFTTADGNDIWQFENLSGTGLRGRALEPWHIFAKIPASASLSSGDLSKLIDYDFLGGTKIGDYVYLPINALPSWKDLNTVEQIENVRNLLLTNIPDPYDSTKQFFGNDWVDGKVENGGFGKRGVNNICAIINEYLKLDFHKDVVALRNALQAEFKAWGVTGASALSASPAAAAAAANKPSFTWVSLASNGAVVNGAAVFTDAEAFARQPTGAAAVKVIEVKTPSGDAGENISYVTVKSDVWESWNFAYQQFKAALNKYTTDTGGTKSSKETVNAAMAASAEKCANLSHQIEQLWSDMMGGLQQKIADLFLNYGLPNVFPNLSDDKIAETRFYVMTWVTKYGEESAPSPVSDALEIDQYDMPKFQLPSVYPKFPKFVGGTTDIETVTLRIYRSNAGSDTAAFQFVYELPYVGGNPDTTLITIPIPGNLSITLTNPGHASMVGNLYYWYDFVKAGSLGEVLPSTTWSLQPYRTSTAQDPNAPISGIGPWARGLINTAGSCMAAFIDNNLYFCEPGHPYAWPDAYRKTVPYPIVGLASVGDAVFVATMGKPSFFVGADPANMAPYHLPDHQACVSRRSIVVGGGGVWYASPDGYCFATTQGVQIATRDLFSVDDWQALNPSSIFAAIRDNVLNFWWCVDELHFGSYALDMNARKLVSSGSPTGFQDYRPLAVFDDIPTQSLYVAGIKGVFRMFAGDPSPGYWRSRIEVLKNQEPLAWLKVEGDQSANNPAHIMVIGDGKNIIPGMANDFSWRGSDSPNYFIVTDIKPLRLPPGRYLEYEVFIKSSARITRVYLSSNTDELRHT